MFEQIICAALPLTFVLAVLIGDLILVFKERVDE